MSDAMKLVEDTMSDPEVAQPLNCAEIDNPDLNAYLAPAPEAVPELIKMQVAAQQVTANPQAPEQAPAPENAIKPQTPTGFS